MIIEGQEKPPLNDLAHHGVKGMKWGVRRAGRAAVSAAKYVDKTIDQNDQEIRDARARHPQVKAKYKAAKKQYKVDKKIQGKKAARAVLNEVGKDYHKNLRRTMDDTSNERAVKAIVDMLAKP